MTAYSCLHLYHFERWGKDLPTSTLTTFSQVSWYLSDGTVVPKMVLWKINKQVPDCGAGGRAMEIEREAELINALWALAALQGKLSETDKSRRGTTPQIMEPGKHIKVATNCLPNIPFLSRSVSQSVFLSLLPSLGACCMLIVSLSNVLHAKADR